MTEPNWETVVIMQGELQAELIRGLLESQGITVQLSQEGAARAYGFTVGPMAAVDVLVPQAQLTEARQVIADYQAGKFEQFADGEETP